jgi:hypothetical protein
MHVQPSWEYKLLSPLVLKAQHTEPLMNVCLTALVKRVAELRRARLKACHYVEKFHLRQIRPLGHRDKCAYECLHMTDPSHEPTDGKLCV